MGGGQFSTLLLCSPSHTSLRVTRQLMTSRKAVTTYPVPDLSLTPATHAREPSELAPLHRQENGHDAQILSFYTARVSQAGGRHGAQERHGGLVPFPVLLSQELSPQAHKMLTAALTVTTATSVPGRTSEERTRLPTHTLVPQALQKASMQDLPTRLRSRVHAPAAGHLKNELLLTQRPLSLCPSHRDGLTEGVGYFGVCAWGLTDPPELHSPVQPRGARTKVRGPGRRWRPQPGSRLPSKDDGNRLVVSVSPRSSAPEQLPLAVGKEETAVVFITP